MAVPLVLRPATTQNSFVTTFGVEFEFVLAFHKDKLNDVLLSATNEARPLLITNPRSTVHDKFLQHGTSSSTAGRKRWPSWVFQVDEDTGNEKEFLDVLWSIGPCPVRLTSGNGAEGEDWRSKRLYLRDYYLEHLMIAQRALANHGLALTVIGCQYDWVNPGSESRIRPAILSWPTERALVWTGKSREHYQNWIVTNDTSLIGATKGELMTALKDSINDGNKDEWDSHGIEMISRVFTLNKLDAACHEIGQYLSTFTHPRLSANGIAQTQQLGAVDSVFSGTHVHIGLSWKTRADVNAHQKFIRHLMFLVLAYEELISKLHPRRRWGIDKKWSPINPIFPPANVNETESERLQRELAEEEVRVSELREKFVSRFCLVSNLSYFARVTLGQEVSAISREDLAKTLFENPDDFQTTETLMLDFQPPKDDWNERHLIVNLSNLRDVVRHRYLDLDDPRDDDLKPTIEFRQHACILNADEVKHWVKFCQALVQLAERRGAQQTNDTSLEPWQQELQKYPTACLNIETLCGPTMLNLDHSESTYWQYRYAQYCNDEKIEFRNRMRRRAERIRSKRTYGMTVNEDERRQLRSARRDLRNDSNAVIPADYHPLCVPLREEYEALDALQLKRIAQHRDSVGERQMKRQRKEDYVVFIQDLDQKGTFGKGTSSPPDSPLSEAQSISPPESM